MFEASEGRPEVMEGVWGNLRHINIPDLKEQVHAVGSINPGRGSVPRIVLHGQARVQGSDLGILGGLGNLKDLVASVQNLQNTNMDLGRGGRQPMSMRNS
jgi:hypothetical protein